MITLNFKTINNPLTIYHEKNAAYLAIQDKKIIKLPANIKKLTNLTLFSVGINELKTIPNMDTLINLTELYLYQNHLTYLPKLPKLGFLVAYCNQLKYLPLIDTLYMLIIHNNKLKFLPSSKNLEYANILNNQIIVCLLSKDIIENNYDLIYNEDV